MKLLLIILATLFVTACKTTENKTAKHLFDENRNYKDRN
jgi:hypothetical protein